MTSVIDVAANFEVCGRPISFEVCKAGHINDTYIVDIDNCGTIDRYILQKINKYVFKKPEQVMSNIIGVTTYLRNILQQDGQDATRKVLHFIKSKQNEFFYHSDSDEYWRMYHYIDDVISYNFADSTDMFEKAGIAFGNFQKLLANYDARTLFETIPNFHNTKRRYERFLEVLENCPNGERKCVAQKEIEFVLRRKKQCEFIVDRINDGRIPLRVTHNDTKLNNILIDVKTNEGICIIDLDTIMSGSALYDFGDAIRFGASSALEDETDLEKVYFRANMFEAFARGYIQGAENTITKYEIKCLPVGVHIITLETGMRFLTDYLENDVYFKTSYPDHNLVRAKNQFKLVYDIEARMEEFDAIINKFI